MLVQVRRVAQHSVLYALLRNERLGEFDAMRPPTTFDVDASGGRVTFRSEQGGELTGRARFLASIAVDPATLLWGFSPSMEQHTGPNEVARRIREIGLGEGFEQLSAEEVPYQVGEGRDQHDVIAALGHDVGQLGVEFFGPDVCYYTYPTGNAGSRGVVLVDQLSEPIPPVELRDVFVKLPRLIEHVDDLSWSLGGLVRQLPGWKVDWRKDSTPERRVFRVVDDKGAHFVGEAAYDGQQRLTRVNLDGLHGI